MKRAAITVRIDSDLLRILDDARRSSKQTRSEVIRDARQRHLALRRFEDLRRRVMPFAQVRGYLTDEDVFKVVSLTA